MAVSAAINEAVEAKQRISSWHTGLALLRERLGQRLGGGALSMGA